MRKIKQKKSELNVVLNSLQPHPSDPTLLEAKFIILDFEPSRNNQLVEKETALGNLSKTIINKPIRGYFNEEEQDFGDHEVTMTDKTLAGLERGTIPMGVFISEGYVENLNIDGIEKEVLVADAVLWKSQFIKPIMLLEKWFEEGLTISMSCEYLYANVEFVDGVEVHKEPLYFEAHAILGQDVIPAYESARLVTVEQLSEFNQLVAQAVNQIKEKEDVILEEKENLENFENQLNEASHDQIRELIRSKSKEVIEGVNWLWVADVYSTYAILEIEKGEDDNYTTSYMRIDYSISDNQLTVNAESLKEVKQERQWVEVTNVLQNQLNEVLEEKEALTNKFNEVSETIVSLNSKIEELLPYQQQVLNAQREQKLTELTTKFEKAFNNAGAKEKFESEEVKTLLNEAVDSSEAFLALNTMVVDLITELQVKENTGTTMLGLNSIRQDLLPKTQEDDFDSIYSL